MTNQQTFDRYQIQSKIAQGGMATVHLAHDPRFGRDVALKVLSVVYKDEPAFRERFEREARTVATLEHPAIVPVYDFGEDHDQLFLVMRHMQGGSLADRIVLQPFELDTAVPIIRRIASALDHAHANGVIHRDLKPANILFDQYNNAFLSDFGIVKLAAEATTGGLTGSGVIGTPAYMSPEQIHGDQTLDGRSDIYTLGIILFELLTGFKPYRADTPVKQMMAHVLNPIPSIRKYNPLLPPACEALIRKAMAKERGERFATAAALHHALRVTATGVHAHPVNERLPPDASHFVAAENALAAEDDETNTAVPLPQDPPTILSTPLSENAAPVVEEETSTIVRSKSDVPRARRRWMFAAVIALLLVGGSLLMFSRFSDNEMDATPSENALVLVAGAVPTPSTQLTPTMTPTPKPTASATAVSLTVAPGPMQRTIGESALGEPITAHLFGTGEQMVVMVGGIHAGWAPGTVTLAERVIAQLKENPALVPSTLTVAVIANLNPDSEAVPGELNGRLNGNGVDLNRNWDCKWRSDPLWRTIPSEGLGGTAPFSEPEVAALRAFILANDVQAVIFWQARVQGGLVSPGSCGTESTVSAGLATIYGNAAGYLVTDFESLARQEVNGDSTNWLDEQGIPAVSVLLPAYEAPDFDHNWAGVLAVWAQFSTEE